MTRKGAQFVIESLTKRYLEIQEVRARLDKEEADLQARILELEQVQDPIQPSPIVSIGT
jgi:hypothetical protein